MKKSIKKFVTLLFLFLSISTFAGILEDNIIKVRVIVRGVEYISYVVISDFNHPNIFSIIGGEL